MMTAAERIRRLTITEIHPLYVTKAERKGRTRAEVDAVIQWLTGYDQAGLERQIADGRDFAAFFAEAPALNPAWESITGTICGVRVETIADQLERQVRCLDKLVDELAKGKSLDKVLRRG